MQLDVDEMEYGEKYRRAVLTERVIVKGERERMFFWGKWSGFH